MTKKAEKLLNKLEEKMNVVLYLYRNDFDTYEKALYELKERNQEFNNMITSMLFYDLLSENDFLELNRAHHKLYYLYFEKLLDIKYNN